MDLGSLQEQIQSKTAIIEEKSELIEAKLREINHLKIERGELDEQMGEKD